MDQTISQLNNLIQMLVFELEITICLIDFLLNENLDQVSLHEGSFTELFTELTKLLCENASPPFDTENLKTTQKYTSQDIDILLRGLQEVGFLLSSATYDNPELIKLFSSIGFFISSISNLVEALNTLRGDLNHFLNQQNYESKI